MERIVYKGKNIAYQVSGRGIPLVLLHGFCEDSRVWENFSELINDCKTIQIDLPGFGQSDLAEQQSMEQMAESVKFILDHLSIEKCILLGHSMGGYVNLAFAKKYEHRLLGLGLFHSHPYADTEAGINNRNKSIQFIQRNNHILYIKQLIPKLFSHNYASDNNFLVNKLIHQSITYSSETIIQTLKAMRDRSDQSTILSKISCPVLFIIGKKDNVISLERSLEQTYLPSVSVIEILPKVGHMGMYESPKKIAKKINNFVQFCNTFNQ